MFIVMSKINNDRLILVAKKMSSKNVGKGRTIMTMIKTTAKTTYRSLNFAKFCNIDIEDLAIILPPLH